MMKLTLIALVILLIGAVLCKNSTSTNSSGLNKDMYVIHAMVYQVGILTNKTDDKALNSNMGNQEALTFYHTNGSNVDLSAIPSLLLTNVTAQSMVQIATKAAGVNDEKSKISWSTLKDLASLPQTSSGIRLENGVINITKRSVFDGFMPGMLGEIEYFEVPKTEEAIKRSVNSPLSLFKRTVPDDKTTFKVVKGAAVIPQGAGVQSIAIPPLLSLNNNLSDIPVPIPNTSVVHYAKINTVVRKL